MTMKLPILLSTMIAALAIPTLASEAAAPAEAAPMDANAAPEAAPMEPNAAAPADANAAPAMEEQKPAKKKKRHHGKKHHKRHHHKSGQGHTPDEYDKPWDYINKGSDSSSGCSGSSSSDSGKTLPEEVPGQKGPNVPRGE